SSGGRGGCDGPARGGPRRSEDPTGDQLCPCRFSSSSIASNIGFSFAIMAALRSGVISIGLAACVRQPVLIWSQSLLTKNSPSSEDRPRSASSLLLLRFG